MYGQTDPNSYTAPSEAPPLELPVGDVSEPNLLDTLPIPKHYRFQHSSMALGPFGGCQYKGYDTLEH